MKLAQLYNRVQCTVLLVVLAVGLNNSSAMQDFTSPNWTDPSPHRTLQIPVEQEVQLEVLEWAGQGSPLIFLAGLGNTVHIWDDFAPQFTNNHYVYAIMRRGFGHSSQPLTDAARKDLQTTSWLS